MRVLLFTLGTETLWLYQRLGLYYFKVAQNSNVSTNFGSDVAYSAMTETSVMLGLQLLVIVSFAPCDGLVSITQKIVACVYSGFLFLTLLPVSACKLTGLAWCKHGTGM